MSTERFLLEKCNPTDIIAVAQIYIDAFRPNAMNRTWAPDHLVTESSMMKWTILRFTKAMTQREMIFQKLTDLSVTPHKIVAWHSWTAPFVLDDDEISKRAEQDRADIAAGAKWPEEAIIDACETMFGYLDDAKAEWAQTDKMYVCHLLCVDPQYQGHGLGTRLLQEMLRLADATGSVSYIEATAAGHRLDERLGWYDVDTLKVDLSRWDGEGYDQQWVMLRQPQLSDAVIGK